MTTNRPYDVIVIGMGAMGSATVYELASRGLRVLGLERFDIPHDRGSSHGVSRIIRLAYSEHPSYVPLLRRAYDRWRELESAGGEKLLHITGSVDTGRPEGPVFSGSLQSCIEYDLPHETLSSEEVARRFPGCWFPAEWMSVYQPDGGFLMSERCIVAYVTVALERGSDVRAREAVLEWDASGDTVRGQTTRGSYEAGSLVITTGAWAGPLVPSLDHLLAPERQVLGWFQPLRPEVFASNAFPVVIGEFEEGRYYASPVFGVPGFKIGKFHHLNEPTTADGLDRECTTRTRRCCGRPWPATSPTPTAQRCRFELACSQTPPTSTSSLTRCPARPTSTWRRGFLATASNSPALLARSWPTCPPAARPPTTSPSSAWTAFPGARARSCEKGEKTG